MKKREGETLRSSDASLLRTTPRELYGEKVRYNRGVHPEGPLFPPRLGLFRLKLGYLSGV